MASKAAKKASKSQKLILLADVKALAISQSAPIRILPDTRAHSPLQPNKRCPRVPVSATLLRPREFFVKRPRTCLNRRCCLPRGFAARPPRNRSHTTRTGHKNHGVAPEPREPRVPTQVRRRPERRRLGVREGVLVRSRRPVAWRRHRRASSPGMMMSAQVRVRGGGRGGAHRRE